MAKTRATTTDPIMRSIWRPFRSEAAPSLAGLAEARLSKTRAPPLEQNAVAEAEGVETFVLAREAGV